MKIIKPTLITSHMYDLGGELVSTEKILVVQIPKDLSTTSPWRSYRCTGCVFNELDKCFSFHDGPLEWKSEATKICHENNIIFGKIAL